MIACRLFKAFQQRSIIAAAQSAMPFYNAPMRLFSEQGEQAPKPKSKKSKAAAADENILDRALFEPYSVGNIREVGSTPDHKAPSEEDTIEGRYAGVLFSTAS
jgi:hypothetical protein